MKIECIPLIQLQRDFYNIPRGQERFQVYLETMLNADVSDVDLLPMVIMNPMGRGHIPEVLDMLLAIDADSIAKDAISKTLSQFEDITSVFKLGLVVADDRMGAWTNRYTSEFSLRFEMQNHLKRGWLTVPLWTSEEPSVQKVQEETLTTVYRVAYVQRHGLARTLQEMLNQEGYAMAMAGCHQPILENDDMTYTDKIISPYLLTQDYSIIMTCLFGDPVAHALGYKPQGLSEGAGLAWALYQAQHNNLSNS
ncbi:MAG: hypothetical protein AAF572_06575 [Cyanobacteria bacterium P01_B01_bin.77]